jgi:tetratricopeptide (TPR) repeat protein
MVCPRCGQVSSVHAGRCTACGATLAPAALTGVITVEPAGVTGDPTLAIAGGTFDAPTGSASDAAPASDASSSNGTAGTAATAEVGAVAPTASGPLNVGQSFGPRYHIIRILGVGGMGAVYQAWDAELGVAVALKVIRADRRRGSGLPAAEKRFKNELLLARQVTHKNVVRIHDISEIDGIKFITMPYIQGDDLATLLRHEGKLPVARALHVAREIACGLQAAHEAGVVHRDLKPANIMIGTTEDEHALIMDFGISASADAAADGRIVGTLEYMSPEQGIGGTVDSRSDLYAFGLILHELLVGRRGETPKTAEKRFEAMKQRFEEGVPPLRSIDPSIPEPLAAVVARCVERNPGARYQTTAELAAALDAIDDAGELIPVPARISKRVLRVAILFLLVLLAGMYVIGRRFAPGPAPVHETVPVLIADFDNRSGDAVFDGSVEQTLALALEQASYITVFKTNAARSIVAQVAPGKGDRITEEMGQLIARREGLKVVMTGAIDKRPAGYRIEVRASDAASGKPITTAAQDVREKEQVPAAVGVMAKRVREALGESKTEMAKLAAAETVTAGSLDAMRAYARAQELSLTSRFPEALAEYQRAADLDPGFGRAYAGMAGVYANYFKQPEKAEASYQAALKHLDRMTEREKYRTLGTYYLDIARNYEKAIENFESLVTLYPADDGGHGNLALAYVLLGNNLPRAAAEVRKSLEIYPNNTLQRYNYAMYSMYAGDFATAIAEGTRLVEGNPSFEYNYLPIALSQLAQGSTDASRQTYDRLAQVSPTGASFAARGVADLEMYFGRHRIASGLLRDAIAADKQRSDTFSAAQKSVALAEAYLAMRDRPRAVQAANEAVALSRHESTLYPAARVLVEAGQYEKAAQVAQTLENMLQRHTTAYARLITGEIAEGRGRVPEAIDAFRDSQKRRDSWFARFLLGKAYVEAGHFAEALAELELCVKRRGETTDVFFYDTPTLRYLPPVYYWLGLAQEGVGSRNDARKSYEEFLALRGAADPVDPLAADARSRLAALTRQ